MNQGDQDCSLNSLRRRYSRAHAALERAQLRVPYMGLTRLLLDGAASVITPPPFSPSKTWVEGVPPVGSDDPHLGQVFIQTTPIDVIGQNIRSTLSSFAFLRTISPRLTFSCGHNSRTSRCRTFPTPFLDAMRSAVLESVLILSKTSNPRPRHKPTIPSP